MLTWNNILVREQKKLLWSSLKKKAKITGTCAYAYPIGAQ